VLVTAPLICSVGASFMRLPADYTRPQWRAGDIRLAILRVCQPAAVETTVLTEQTEL